MRIFFAILGALMLFGGGFIALFVANMSTTVPDEYGKPIHNIGLIGTQQADTTLFSAVAVAGSIVKPLGLNEEKERRADPDASTNQSDMTTQDDGK